MVVTAGISPVTIVAVIVGAAVVIAVVATIAEISGYARVDLDGPFSIFSSIVPS